MDFFILGSHILGESIILSSIYSTTPACTKGLCTVSKNSSNPQAAKDASASGSKTLPHLPCISPRADRPRVPSVTHGEPPRAVDGTTRLGDDLFVLFTGQLQRPSMTKSSFTWCRIPRGDPLMGRSIPQCLGSIHDSGSEFKNGRCLIYDIGYVSHCIPLHLHLYNNGFGIKP